MLSKKTSAMPQTVCVWVWTQCPHAGLIHSWLIHGRCTSQCMGLVATSPAIHKWWRSLLRRVANHRQQALVCVFLTVACDQNMFCSGSFDTSCCCRRVIPKWTTIFTTGTPILHLEASFISAERGLRREILSQTSLNHNIHFSSILKLIRKQLKRPMAFGAVHIVGHGKRSFHKKTSNCTLWLQIEAC